MSFLNYSEQTSWIWKKVVFHWWLSATFIWQILTVLHCGQQKGFRNCALKHSQLFHCQGNPFFSCLVAENFLCALRQALRLCREKNFMEWLWVMQLQNQLDWIEPLVANFSNTRKMKMLKLVVTQMFQPCWLVHQCSSFLFCLWLLGMPHDKKKSCSYSHMKSNYWTGSK